MLEEEWIDDDDDDDDDDLPMNQRIFRTVRQSLTWDIGNQAKYLSDTTRHKIK